MTQDTSSRRIFLIRHGTTDWLEQRLLHGHSDRPLSPFGLEQARLTASAMQGETVSRMFSSPLLRTMQTAQAVGKTVSVDPEPLDGLMEMHFGWMEGKRDRWHDVKDNKVLFKIYYSLRMLAGLVSGESHGHFQKRVRNAWKFIREQDCPKGLVVVAHFEVLRTILNCEFNNQYSDITKFMLLPCSISEVEVNNSQPTHLIRLNDTSHLNGLGNK